MPNYENNVERPLEWDDEIVNDFQEYTILPEGEYPFEVSSIERGRHSGSDNLPACYKAIVHLKVTGATGTVPLKHNLFLHSKTEGLICAFFVAIGLRKPGERLRMDWNATVGRWGRAELEVHEYTGNDGREYKINRVKKFIPPDSDKQAAPRGYAAGEF
jgi:hypothetical protein